jgi:hypothetical protein
MEERNMKKLIAALALVAGASAVPAFASNVAVSISVGEPGFYGHLDIGGYGRPALIYREPVVVVKKYRGVAPAYVRVPADHSRNWNRYCGRYDACSRPVYFVRDEWYRDVYSPRYRQLHNRHWNDGRWNDARRDHDRWDNDRRGNDRWDHDRRNDRRDYDRRDHDGRRDDRDDRHDNRRDHGKGHDRNRDGHDRGGRRS